MKNKEQCFVFYERWHTQLQRLPPEEKLQMYEAICKYAFGLETDEMAYYLESLMDNIRIAIDNDRIKQEEYSKRMFERSRKAVEARKKKYSEPQVTTSELQVTTSELQVTTSEPQVTTSELQVTTSEPQVTTSELQVTTSELQVTNNKNKNKNKKEDIVVEEVVVVNTREENFEEISDFEKLQNYINEIKQDKSWQEIVCMKYHISLTKLEQMFSGFITDCQIQGTIKHENLDAVRYHFANWLRIQIDQENKKKNDTSKKLKDSKRRGYGVTAASAEDYTERL